MKQFFSLFVILLTFVETESRPTTALAQFPIVIQISNETEKSELDFLRY